MLGLEMARDGALIIETCRSALTTNEMSIVHETDKVCSQWWSSGFGYTSMSETYHCSYAGLSCWGRYDNDTSSCYTVRLDTIVIPRKKTNSKIVSATRKVSMALCSSVEDCLWNHAPPTSFLDLLASHALCS